ncbi:M949_RS01915 family surface polysaccharide biosynthesis protein [Vogesella facilis]|uniref:M949_RS01915 family surface polysaccharide biosynthesis protein n=1 Tax=Vogesella facilis TaxID=1655232 RepID=A0ABV7RAJ7_9NEIS
MKKTLFAIAITSTTTLSLATEFKTGDITLEIDYLTYNTKKEINIIGRTSKGIELKVKDHVTNCTEDKIIEIIEKSIEQRTINSTTYYFIGYRIGCAGGIDPLTVKYFAYSKGTKYSLRGEEKIITPNSSFGGENPPIESTNLKNKPALREYMTQHWKKIQIRKYD